MTTRDVMLTTRTAKPSDIWPDGSGLSKAAEAEIIRIARDEVSATDCVGSSFALWYAPFVVAEARWKERQKQKVVHAANETENAKKIATLERRLLQARKDLNSICNIVDTLFAPSKDKPDGEMVLFDLIRSVAWKMIHDRKVMRDAGIWVEDKLYGPGAAVTNAGALWVCQQENKGVRPGDGVAWRLTHKTETGEIRRHVRAELERQQQKGKSNGVDANGSRTRAVTAHPDDPDRRSHT